MKVLYIEDLKHYFKLIEALIAEAAAKEAVYSEIELIHAETLTKGLDMLDKTEADAVLLDLGLPDSQGYETVKTFRQRNKTAPIVVFSANDDEMLIYKTLNEGAQDYLIKGQEDAKTITRALKYAVERKRSEDAYIKLMMQKQQALTLEKEIQDEIIKYKCFAKYEDQTHPIISDCKKTNNNLMNDFINCYYDIIINYVKAVRLGQKKPSEELWTLSERLSVLNVSAENIIYLHLKALNEVSVKIRDHLQERKFSVDARLALIELIGCIADIYNERHLIITEKGGFLI
ncbi:Signal transduction response regulator, receiver region domain protein [Candidatus Magnetoovum chiemensis]|nr:Signal transduction response regulator, receiver region domain protein [Candidatus Magnetoovum chiemensis]